MRRRILYATTAALALTLVATAAIAQSSAKRSPTRPAAHDKTHATEGRASPYTLLEVMQHLNASQQQIQTGLLMNNRLMIHKGARAIADHPMPRGGIKPYIKKNHQALKSTIKAMDQQVHKTAVTLAERASTARMVELQALNDKMVVGCISCHDVFRD